MPISKCDNFSVLSSLQNVNFLQTLVPAQDGSRVTIMIGTVDSARHSNTLDVEEISITFTLYWTVIKDAYVPGSYPWVHVHKYSPDTSTTKTLVSANCLHTVVAVAT